MRENEDFLTKRSKDVVLAAAKVGVDLTGQDGILRDIRLTGVLIERQDEEPRYAYYDAYCGEVWWELEKEGRGTEGKKACSCRLWLSVSHHCVSRAR